MTARTTLVVCLLFMGPAALAAPKPSAPKPSAAKLVKQAESLEMKDPFAAQRLLEQALELSPDDPAILAELGYAAYQAKDLPAAEQATRRALTLAKDDHLKAAANYNLGLILTSKGDKPGAAAAYAEAARLRGGAFAATALAGPYPSIDDFCKQWLARKDSDRDDAKGEDACAADDDAKATLDGHEVRVVVAGWEGDSRIHKTWHEVAIQVGKSWWIGPLFMLDSPGGTGGGNMKLELGKLRVVDLGGGHAVMIADRESNVCRDERDYVVETATDWLGLCGIGKSGKPSCTGSISVGELDDTTDKGKLAHSAWSVTPSFPGKGIVKLTAVHKKGLSGAPKDTVGAHAVTFP